MSPAAAGCTTTAPRTARGRSASASSMRAAPGRCCGRSSSCRARTPDRAGRGGRRCGVERRCPSWSAGPGNDRAPARGRRGRPRLPGARAGRIAVDRWAYDQQALTMVVRHERPHAAPSASGCDAADRWRSCRCADGRTGVTWVERPADARRWRPCRRAELLAALDEATGGALGRTGDRERPVRLPAGRAACAAATWRRASRWSATPLTASTRSMPRASTWAWPTSGRWWSSGGGAARRLDLGSGEALLPYARARRGDNTQRLWLTDGLVRLFTADLPRCASRAALHWTPSSACRH